MKYLVGALSAIWLWVLPATIAMAVLAALLAVLNLTGRWPWFVWLLLLPTLYAVWLVLFLLFCVPMMRRLGTRFPKPSKATIPGPGAERQLRAVVASSLRMRVITSLPLVAVLQQSGWGRNLVMRGYAPAVHMGKGVQMAGQLMDPDLTEVGDFALIGAGAMIAAHLWTILPTGKRLYFTSRVKIGARATVGGGSIVSCGCTIGEDAVIEPQSYLAPFTEIPASEIWGGRPAVYVRTRIHPQTTSGAGGSA
jgi:hypothetical protein